LWIGGPTAYYGNLMEVDYRSTAGRCKHLMGDIRIDIVDPLFAVARRVLDLDRWREASIWATADLNFPERLSAQAQAKPLLLRSGIARP
jgi:hypothetical protein